MENPVERLRNKLTPYITLVELLNNENPKINFGNPSLNELFYKTLNVCIQNNIEIHKHLNAIELNFDSENGLS